MNCVPLEYLAVDENFHNTVSVKHKQTAWSSSLVLGWAGICLTHGNNGKENKITIPLPSTVGIPRSLNHLVSTILEDVDAQVTLLLKCGPSAKEHSLKLQLPQAILAPHHFQTSRKRECTNEGYQ